MNLLVTSVLRVYKIWASSNKAKITLQFATELCIQYWKWKSFTAICTSKWQQYNCDWNFWIVSWWNKVTLSKYIINWDIYVLLNYVYNQSYLQLENWEKKCQKKNLRHKYTKPVYYCNIPTREKRSLIAFFLQ